MGYNDGITIIFPAFPTCACPSLQSKPSVQGLQPHRVHSTSVTQDLLQLAISPAQFNAAVDAVAQQVGEVPGSPILSIQMVGMELSFLKVRSLEGHSQHAALDAKNDKPRSPNAALAMKSDKRRSPCDEKRQAEITTCCVCQEKSQARISKCCACFEKSQA